MSTHGDSDYVSAFYQEDTAESQTETIEVWRKNNSIFKKRETGPPRPQKVQKTAEQNERPLQ